MAFIRKRGDTWYLYWTADGKKHGRSLKTNRKALAQQYLTEFEYKLATNQLGQAADVSLARLKDEYPSYCKATRRESTCRRHTLPRVTRFISFLQERGSEKASQVKEAHVQEYQQHLLEDLKPVTVRHCMYAASGLMSFAVERGYLNRNAVKNVAKVKASKNPPRYLSFDEWETVRRIAEDIYLWPLVATAYYAGFRNSELRFLTWPEIDFDRDAITLVNKEGFTLKSRESRTVPLNRELKEILQPLAQQSGYCFLNTNGKQFDDRELSREFRKLVVEPSGLSDFALHTLRHTFASHLVMKG